MSLLSTAPARPRPSPPPDPYTGFVHAGQESVRAFYDALGDQVLTCNHRARCVRARIERLLRFLVPREARVLDVGCGCGEFLAGLEPREGVGIDHSPAMVDLARRRHPRLTFTVGQAEALEQADIPDGPYDYVTLVNVTHELPDVALALRAIHRYCSAHTRVVIVQRNPLWRPICRMASKLGLRPAAPEPNWLTAADLANLLRLSGYEPVRTGWRMTSISHFGFINYVVARPLVPIGSADRYTCSVVVPCKNEQDNVAGLVERIPEMGAGTQVVFVDDQSTDATAQRVQEAMRRRPDRSIRLVKGPGRGKGAACRAGFAAATGDVFMILDADMTVMPEELPAFFDAITSAKGEFINGSRLVYPRAAEAMRPLNVLGNKVFAGLFSLLLGQRIRDTLCGTKVIWARDYAKLMAAREYFDSCDSWGDYDWIFGAAKNHLKIIELPVHYCERVAGETKMTRRFRNAWIMLKMCWLALRKLRWA